MTNMKRTELTALIDDLFKTAMEIQAKYIRHSACNDLSLSEVHVLEAVALEEEPTMSHVSTRLMITMGTLTTSVARIIEKGYLYKEKSVSDRRVCFLRLTKKGEFALKIHQDFHHKLEEMILEPFIGDDYLWVTERLQKVLESLQEVQSSYMK